MIKFYFKILHSESLSKVIILHRLILLNILLHICVCGIYTCLCVWVNINSVALCKNFTLYSGPQMKFQWLVIVHICATIAIVAACCLAGWYFGSVFTAGEHLWWVFFLITFRVPLSASGPKKDSKQGGSY